MGFFYQHIGKKLFARDAPISLGKPGALRRFSLHTAQQSGSFIEQDQGCQIWGLPSGAAGVCSHMDRGDYLMLLESENFLYVGMIVFRWPEFREDLSEKMWGEAKFPIIVAIEGRFIKFPWDEFVQRFGFRPTYYMRGNTMSLRIDRVRTAGFADERQLFDWIVSEYGV